MMLVTRSQDRRRAVEERKKDEKQNVGLERNTKLARILRDQKTTKGMSGGNGKQERQRNEKETMDWSSA